MINGYDLVVVDVEESQIVSGSQKPSHSILDVRFIVEDLKLLENRNEICVGIREGNVGASPSTYVEIHTNFLNNCVERHLIKRHHCLNDDLAVLALNRTNLSVHGVIECEANKHNLNWFNFRSKNKRKLEGKSMMRCEFPERQIKMAKSSEKPAAISFWFISFSVRFCSSRLPVRVESTAVKWDDCLSRGSWECCVVDWLRLLGTFLGESIRESVMKMRTTWYAVF